MKIKEFGTQNKDTIMMLHGGGLSWWNYKDEIPLLQDKFHVIIPILDGHAGSDNDFTSIEENAKKLCDYCKERFEKPILAICGLSLGGQILVEMLSQVPDICQYAFIESALVIPMRFTHRMLPFAFEMSYGLIKKLWFAKLQFRQLRIKADLFEEYYRDTCKITCENMIAFLQCNSAYLIKDTLSKTTAKTVIIVGEKESRKMRKSATLLHTKIADSRLLVMPHYYHGELSINHAEEYVELIEKANEKWEV